MRTLARALSAASILVPVLGTSAALAQPPHRWDGDIHHFQGRDFERWRGGGWFHGLHEGRDGWWWVVGPDFYFYPAPVYPYPDPYVPPVVARRPGARLTHLVLLRQPARLLPLCPAMRRAVAAGAGAQ